MSRITDTGRSQVTGVILAGGRGSRMGGKDKGLLLWKNQPLYQHVLQRFQPQVANLLINANRHIEVYQQSGAAVFSDSLPDYPGPLAGILASLQYVGEGWVAFAPCDTPGLPLDLVDRLWSHKSDALAVWARSDSRDHPTLALLHCSLAVSLAQFLAAGDRKLMQFLQQSGGHSVHFHGEEEAFNNMNFPADLGS